MDERLLERYGSPEGADAYRRKYEKSPLRKMSGRRELRLVERALALVGVGGSGLHEVLDVPCGAGRLVPTLLSKAMRVTAVDVSPAMVALAKDALAAPIAAGRVVVAEGSADALPFGDGAFDAAVCWRLLHHLTDRAARVRILAELRRVSKRAVVVSFADAGTFKAMLQAFRGRDRRCVKLSRAALGAEAAEAGLALASAWRLSTAFSLLAAAVLLPTDAPR